MNRGEVWWVRFDPSVGGEIQKTRPAVIFSSGFPEIATLADLKRVMEQTEPFEFCGQYLNINANRSAADKNPKYRLLKTLTDGFLEYQKFHNITSEIDAIRHWSKNVKPNDLKHDFIAKMHGVGPGVVGNIKLNLGERVIKPDRHVIGVMKEFLKVDISLIVTMSSPGLLGWILDTWIAFFLSTGS